MPSSPQAASPYNPDNVASATRPGFGFGADSFSPLMQEVQTNEKPFKAAIEQGRVEVVVNWRQGFCGRGCERYPSGEVYVGEFVAGERGGRGTFKHKNGQILVSAWMQNAPVGEGVQWAADGKKAALLMNGKPTKTIPLDEAAKICDKLGLPPPEAWVPRRKPEGEAEASGSE